MKLSEASNRGAHPHARAQAQAMEAHGYQQVDGPSDLTDGDDVMIVSLADGRVGPARYHRHGLDVDGVGRRSSHIFELYPGSPMSDMLPYEQTLRANPDANPDDTGTGEKMSRMGIFRPTTPEHSAHGAPLYAARQAINSQEG